MDYMHRQRFGKNSLALSRRLAQMFCWAGQGMDGGKLEGAMVRQQAELGRSDRMWPGADS
jgi:hypothetical protein